ncbi:nitric oxide synthase oxygenase [Virgisporangium ochraceum]|uniref:Nitric oxide synthase oxygenase n=1 Tax=Virgisporangium ochraceum TaxID=65505 RepID=A0A8J4E883_9ACTN|nr:nitric oxide synthase oxygenase [Virgisporangium ochraceum]GIJ65905.1 nitric oxide synthase oxygenase [Virgisporangium ochraceum]
MPVPGYRDAPALPWQPEATVDSAEAAEFIRRVHTDQPGLGPAEPRLAEVAAEIAATGTYTHTPAELTHGARLAWRNASRCIGRLYWKSLVVRDRRHVTGADEIFSEVVDHLRTAGDRDRKVIRPVITIFAPAGPRKPYARIWNEQLVRYAGYRRPDGSVLGDPRYVDFTTAMAERGWQGKREAFDVLPVVVQTPGDGVRVFDLPDDAVWEVPLAHPDLPWFGDLNLRWHAVPAISNMRLSIGGVNYPLAPFNGWYLGTEIGGRNLADADRYNLLPLIAKLMGLDTGTERSLWRDRALIELNRAVLWSFDRAGARISDHHTESRHFITHCAKEEKAGRVVPADWTWIVPPVSGGITPVFHRYYAEIDQRPNFYLDEDARDLATSGRPQLHRPSPRPSPRPHQHALHQHPQPARCPARGRVPTPRLPLRPAVPQSR